MTGSPRYLFALLFCLAWIISSCGVKGPPLPPISAKPNTSEEKSLGRQAVAQSPLPAPKNSAGPLVVPEHLPTPLPTSE